MSNIPVEKRVTDNEIKEALLAVGGIYTAAVTWLKHKKEKETNRKTIERRVKASADLQEARKEATEILLDVSENKLLQLINQGDRSAIIFFLKCKGKERGYIERQEITGTMKTEVQKPNPYDELSTAELKKLAGIND